MAFAPVTVGFRELGFQPSGRVFFSYAIALSGDGTGYTAEAAGDLDDDSATQYWAFPVPAAIGCDVTNLVASQLGPCNQTFGQSAF